MTEVSLAGIYSLVPETVITAMVTAAADLGSPLFLCGGAVRDLLMNRAPTDLDFTLAAAGPLARRLARDLPATLVVLDEKEQAWRLVWKGIDLDITGMRGRGDDIIDDLSFRDFTVNALAVALDHTALDRGRAGLIDPGGGIEDLVARRLRMVNKGAFAADPLRRLRAFRFAAALDFTVVAATMSAIGEYSGSLAGVASERINHELEQMLASGRAATGLELMRDNGILGEVMPELYRGAGMAQPASHHLDVLDHGIAALTAVEELIGDPGRFYPDHGRDFTAWIRIGNHKKNLRWAALLHDVGKPDCFALRGERITFYNHDQVGGRLVCAIGRRLRWSRRQQQRVAHLIRLHMWPFHLNNAGKKTGITPRACLRLYRAAGDDLAGLFLLAMADCIAGRGPGRPEMMEEDLAGLYAGVITVVRERIRPIRRGRPLLTGHDLKAMGITPGPVFRRILDGLEEARVNAEVNSSEEAAAWVARFLSVR